MSLMCERCGRPVAADRQDTIYACFDCEPQTRREMRAALDAAGIATCMKADPAYLWASFAVFCDGRKWEVSNWGVPGRCWVLWGDDRSQRWTGTYAGPDLIRMLGGIS